MKVIDKEDYKDLNNTENNTYSKQTRDLKDFLSKIPNEFSLRVTFLIEKAKLLKKLIKEINKNIEILNTQIDSFDKSIIKNANLKGSDSIEINYKNEISLKYSFGQGLEVVGNKIGLTNEYEILPFEKTNFDDLGIVYNDKSINGYFSIYGGKNNVLEFTNETTGVLDFSGAGGLYLYEKILNIGIVGYLEGKARRLSSLTMAVQSDVGSSSDEITRSDIWFTWFNQKEENRRSISISQIYDKIKSN